MHRPFFAAYSNGLMDQNKSCYQFQRIQFENGILDTCVDATYIIHLVGNGRYDSIQEQLQNHNLTQCVYILHNSGYKTCSKVLEKSAPAYDLTDAFLQTFRHAAEKGYGNILVLEDDFFFSPKIENPVVVADICGFLAERANDRWIYSLGCIPFIQSIGTENHHRAFLSLGSHAAIYSAPVRAFLLEECSQKDIVDWDLFQNMNGISCPRYMYTEPLCYQIFPSTENSRSWYNPFGIADLIRTLFSWVGLDKEAEPGYLYFYRFSKGMFLFVLALVVIGLYYLGKYVLQIHEKSRKKRG